MQKFWLVIVYCLLCLERWVIRHSLSYTDKQGMAGTEARVHMEFQHEINTAIRLYLPLSSTHQPTEQWCPGMAAVWTPWWEVWAGCSWPVRVYHSPTRTQTPTHWSELPSLAHDASWERRWRKIMFKFKQSTTAFTSVNIHHRQKQDRRHHTYLLNQCDHISTCALCFHRITLNQITV